MKHLPLQNPRYIALLKEFSLHVKRLGYNKYSQQSLPSSVREFFYRLEQQDIHSLDGMTPELISRHYEYLSRRPNQTRPGNLSQSMLQSHVWALKTFFNYQEAEGNVKENPFSVLHFPAPKHARREVLTREEIRKLYRACETPRDRAMLGLFYGCGLRKSEAEKLNLKDISFRSRLLYVRSGKGKKRRVVPVTKGGAGNREGNRGSAELLLPGEGPHQEKRGSGQPEIIYAEPVGRAHARSELLEKAAVPGPKGRDT